MTKEEAKERFGDNIINKLLSLGAEPTNVCRNDDIVEWCSDGCIKVGDIEVWAYYYFYEGENPDLCNWEDRMEIDAVGCWQAQGETGTADLRGDTFAGHAPSCLVGRA